jgi:O-antigen ligase
VTKVALLTPQGPTLGTAVNSTGLVRSLLLTAVFLLLWISLRPFADLSAAPEVTDAGTLANQVGYSLLFLLLAAWCLAHDPSRLVALVRPLLVVTLLWFSLSVVASWEPSVSARRLAFTLVTLGIAGMALLLPKNVRHFSAVMAAAALIVLAACYLGVFLLPARAIHQATDFIDPDLVGDWRGVFAHKNEASAAMVVFIFIGLFVARVRSARIGMLIVALAAPFLFFTQSRTSIAMLPMTLIVSTLLARIRSPALGITLALSVVAIFNVVSVGSIYLEPVRNLLDAVLTDASFTGRTDIWQFALAHVAERPITGYGFATFWGTPEVVYGMAGGSVWANTAAHAHNAYLNLALTIGIPGAALATLWLVWLPLVDFYRSSPAPSASPLKMLFLRVVLFIAYGSCFESMLLETSALGLWMFMATFGLRLLSVSRVAP